MKLSLINCLATDELERSIARLKREGAVAQLAQYGVFDLARQAAIHPEWAGRVQLEVAQIRQGIKAAHGRPLRFVIWAGMGGSIEDKLMYQGAGLLRRGPRFYALDSTDPAKLTFVLGDIQHRAGGRLADGLRSTLVVGMALGMTSYEPVLNLEKLAALYDRQRLDAKANVIYLTLPESLLHRWAASRGFRRIPLQLEDAYTTAGRHSGPLTRGALYPLALAHNDLRSWIEGAVLSDAEVNHAWRLGSFLHAEGATGRDKVNLFLPPQWKSAGGWTKQNFEESLGKREDLGIKIAMGDGVTPPDRVCLAVRLGGVQDSRVPAVRRAGNPTALVEFPARTPLSHYMQFIHHVVFAVARLRGMEFSTQPSVELYKGIANALHDEARRVGGITKTAGWRQMIESRRRASWERKVTLYYDEISDRVQPGDAAFTYASLIHGLLSRKAIEYGELTFFGDLRFDRAGRRMRRILERAGGQIFRSRGLIADVGEGPAMNHAYHEMIIGHGKCFSTIVLSRRNRSIRSIGYTAEFHLAQFLATKLALARRGRPVVTLLIDDLEERTQAAAARFFRAAAGHLAQMERTA